MMMNIDGQQSMIDTILGTVWVVEDHDNNDYVDDNYY